MQEAPGTQLPSTYNVVYGTEGIDRTTRTAVGASPREGHRDTRVPLARFRGIRHRSESDAVVSLLAALEAKDPYTHRHSIHVSVYAKILARALSLGDHEIHVVQTAALLHDIGKIGIPDEILKKPGRLTVDEFATMKQHSEIGAEILRPVGFLFRESVLVLHHHEWYDGTGYPGGLCGEAIPYGARIIQVADSIDAMISPRSYKPGRSIEHVMVELYKGRAKQFDPAVADVAADRLMQHPDLLALAV